MPAISPGLVPPPELEPDAPAALLRGTVVVVLGVLDVGVLDVGVLDVGVLDVGVAAKATTLLEEGARRSPSPMLGVGKWFAGTPIEPCWRTVPV
jgi:hypothetical protein